MKKKTRSTAPVAVGAISMSAVQDFGSVIKAFDSNQSEAEKGMVGLEGELLQSRESKLKELGVIDDQISEVRTRLSRINPDKYAAKTESNAQDRTTAVKSISVKAALKMGKSKGGKFNATEAVYQSIKGKGVLTMKQVSELIKANHPKMSKVQISSALQALRGRTAGSTVRLKVKGKPRDYKYEAI